MANTITRELKTGAGNTDNLTLKPGGAATLTSENLGNFKIEVSPTNFGQFPVGGAGIFYDDGDVSTKSGVLKFGVNVFNMTDVSKTSTGQSARLMLLSTGSVELYGQDTSGPGKSSIQIDGVNGCRFNASGLAAAQIVKSGGAQITTILETPNTAVAGETHILTFNDLTTNYIGIRSPDAASNYTLTLPSTSGAYNQTLVTDGTGIMEWKSTTLDIFPIASGIATGVSANEHRIVDVSGSTSIFTVGAGGVAGQRFRITAAIGDASVNNITVDFVTNSILFYGVAANDILNTNKVSRTYIFVGGTVGWVYENS